MSDDAELLEVDGEKFKIRKIFNYASEEPSFVDLTSNDYYTRKRISDDSLFVQIHLVNSSPGNTQNKGNALSKRAEKDLKDIERDSGKIALIGGKQDRGSQSYSFKTSKNNEKALIERGYTKTTLRPLM